MYNNIHACVGTTVYVTLCHSLPGVMLRKNKGTRRGSLLWHWERSCFLPSCLVASTRGKRHPCTSLLQHQLMDSHFISLPVLKAIPTTVNDSKCLDTLIQIIKNCTNTLLYSHLYQYSHYLIYEVCIKIHQNQDFNFFGF